jgi:hypothetical protein
MRSFREALHRSLTHLLQLGDGIDGSIVEEVKLAARMAVHFFNAEGVLEAFERSVERASREGLYTMLQEFTTTFTAVASGLAPATLAVRRSSEWTTTWGRLQASLPLFSAPLQPCDYLAAYLARREITRPSQGNPADAPQRLARNERNRNAHSGYTAQSLEVFGARSTYTTEEGAPARKNGRRHTFDVWRSLKEGHGSRGTPSSATTVAGIGSWT